MPFAFRIVLLCAAIALLGLIVSFKLNVQFTPKASNNQLYINYLWPDVDPLLVESQLTSVLENELSAIEGLVNITSISKYESGEITLEFNKGADMAFNKILVYQALRRVISPLAFRIDFPQVNTQKENTQSLLSYVVYPDKLNITTVKNIVENQIIGRINNLPLIASSDVSGLGQESLMIRLDPVALKSFNLNIEKIQSDVLNHLTPVYAGVVRDEEYVFPISVNEEVDLANIGKVKIQDQIELEDIANIKMQFKPDESIHRINGQDVILININAHDNVNRITAAQRVKQLMTQISEEVPLKIEERYDDTAYLVTELKKTLLRSLLSVVILVLFILLFQRSWRLLVALFSSILVSLGITFLVCWILGITLHLYTIAGITISLGLIIDNAIVMLEHFRTFKNRKIFSGVLAASFTTIASLALVFYLPEESKKDLVDFAFIVIISLASSIITAYWYTPAIYSLVRQTDHVHMQRSKLIFRSKVYHHYHRFIMLLVRFRKSLVISCFLLFGLPVFLLPSKWEGQEWYNKSIGNDYYQDEIRPYIDKYLGGSSRLFYRNVFERSGSRSPDKTRLYIWASLPFGHTAEQMSHTLKNVETFIGNEGSSDLYVSQVYSGQTGNITIEFTEEQDKSGEPYTLKNRLIGKSLEWGGVEWDIFGVGKGFSNETSEGLPNFRVLLKGYEFDKLKTVAQELSKPLLKHKRIQEVNTNDHMSWGVKDITQIDFKSSSQKINWRFYEALNISKRYSNTANNAGLIKAGANWVPLQFQLQSKSGYSAESFLNMTNYGATPLYQFGTMEKKLLTPEVHKENRQYLRMLTFDYFGSRNFGDKFLDQVMTDYSTALPIGFTMEKKSWQWWSKAKTREYGILGLAIVIIYIISILFFGNFTQPFLIILLIPGSFIGLFTVFGLGGFYFDQGGYAAFIMLAGLVVNAAIFIFSDYKNLHYRAQSKRVIKAVARKSWTILLTVISTCFGLLPFLINGDTEVFWFSLAVGVIGGLTFSIFLVLIVLPVLMIDKRKLKY
ncbi:MAG: multidrug efflux pump subunit AcrB [Psychroserpens sp.]|jgi:multidrug efflux pump subunit AcrB